MTFVDGCSESVRLNVLLKMEVMVEEQGQEGGKTGSYKLIPWPYDGLCARRRLFQLEVGIGSTCSRLLVPVISFFTTPCPREKGRPFCPINSLKSLLTET